MAYAKKTKDTKEAKEFFSIEGMEIKNVRVISDTVLGFSLCGKGLGLYNLKVVDGAKGKFITGPSQQGKDSKWYPIYAVYFSDADSKEIIEKVESALE